MPRFYLIREAFRMDKVGRERMYVVFILTFFSLLFWAFFEQSGSSVNNFTDRNIDRVPKKRLVGDDDVGKTVQLRLIADASGDDVTSLKDLNFMSQEFLGQKNSSSNFVAAVIKAIKAVEASKEESKRMKEADMTSLIEKITNHPTVTMTGPMTALRENANGTTPRWRTSRSNGPLPKRA